MSPESSDCADSSVGNSAGNFKIHLPSAEQVGFDQDAEWFVLETGEEQRRIRFHDYGEIYNVPGLYEELFYDKLECRSPAVVRSLVGDVLKGRQIEAADLRVLDVGAGNGMVGEQLHELGVGTLVGVDIIPEAAVATERDRPGVYDDYQVCDLTRLTPDEDEYFESVGFTGMTSVAALGFGDIPPAAFAQAYNYVGHEGLVAFTIKESFVSAEDQSGFSRLIRKMIDEKVLVELAERRYRHRLAVTGEPLYYVAYVAEKRDDVPLSWVDQVQPT